MTPINGVELLNSSLWLNNEPNHLNTLEDYGEIQNGKLNDIPNGVNNSAIIEFSDNQFNLNKLHLCWFLSRP